MNRRTFIAGAASSMLLSSHAGIFGRSGKVRLAVVGLMGKGYSDWFPMIKCGMAELVAICDCDRSMIARAQTLLAKEKVDLNLSSIPFYSDYRRLIDDAKRLGIEAMTISTPDHVHCPIAALAMKLGIHCFVQMPLVRTLWELDYFRKCALDKGVVTQMGNQGSSLDSFRRNVEILNSGILGDVREVHIWTNRPVWPQGNAVANWVKNHPNGDALRAGLDWDAWLAVAANRPFLDAYSANAGVYDPWKLGKNVYHTFCWRGLRDFGIGALEMACHMMNLPFRGLELKNVVEVECTFARERNEVTFPLSSTVRWTFASRYSKSRPGVLLPEVKVFWYDGGQMPNIDGTHRLMSVFGMPKTGCLIIGKEGSLLMVDDYGAKCFIAMTGEARKTDVFEHPACKMVARRIPFLSNVTAFASGHYREFIDAVRGVGTVYDETNSRCYSDIGHSIPFMEAILTGVVAQQVAGSLKWDSSARRFDVAAANELMRPYIRRGYEF